MLVVQEYLYHQKQDRNPEFKFRCSNTSNTPQTHRQPRNIRVNPWKDLVIGHRHGMLIVRRSWNNALLAVDSREKEWDTNHNHNYQPQQHQHNNLPPLFHHVFNPRFPKTLTGCFVGTNGSAVVPKRCLAPEKGLKGQLYRTSYHGLVWQQPFL